jgi:hypothetical protein
MYVIGLGKKGQKTSSCPVNPSMTMTYAAHESSNPFDTDRPSA